MSRRDLLRRGAVVGGTLLWTIPVISTLSRAHIRAAHSPATGCCECRKPLDPDDPAVFCPSPQSAADTPSSCAAACDAAGYRTSQYHTAPGYGSISCVPGTGCTAH